MSSPAFGPDALAFYEGLVADNSKAYWQAHKQQYDTQVAQPMRALADTLAPQFGGANVFRPYRDVRFTADKRPYQEFASMAVEHAGATLYLQLSLDGLLLAGGYYQPAKDQLERFRLLQEDTTAAGRLDHTLEQLAADGYPLDDGDPVRTAPRGFPRDHPRIELIRRTRLTVSATHPPGPWLSTDTCLRRIHTGSQTISTWNVWLTQHIGPSRNPP